MFHLSLCLLSVQEILAEYVNGWEAGADIKGHFTFSSGCYSPSLLPGTDGSPQGTSLALLRAWFQSQLSSESALILKRAAPFAPTIFQRHYFCKGGCQPEVTWSISLCSCNNMSCKGSEGPESTFLLAIQIFLWIKMPLYPQFQCKPILQNQSFDVLQP